MPGCCASTLHIFAAPTGKRRCNCCVTANATKADSSQACVSGWTCWAIWQPRSPASISASSWNLSATQPSSPFRERVPAHLLRQAPRRVGAGVYNSEPIVFVQVLALELRKWYTVGVGSAGRPRPRAAGAQPLESPGNPAQADHGKLGPPVQSSMHPLPRSPRFDFCKCSVRGVLGHATVRCRYLHVGARALIHTLATLACVAGKMYIASVGVECIVYL